MSGLLAAIVGSLSGASATVTLTDATVIDVDSGFGASAAFLFTSGGLIQESTSTSGTVTVAGWLDPTTSAPSDYEIRATLSSGTVSGTFGTWQALTSTRSWSVSASGGGGASQSGTILIEIRKGGGSVLDSATFTLSADSF
jgi:hypothetical protein